MILCLLVIIIGMIVLTQMKKDYLREFEKNCKEVIIRKDKDIENKERNYKIRGSEVLKR